MNLYNMRISKDTRADLNKVAKHYNLSASVTVDMLIAKEKRLRDGQRKEGEKKMKRMDNNTCCGCIYENIDDTTEDISKCVCCKRNFEYAKNDYYTRKEDEGKCLK